MAPSPMRETSSPPIEMCFIGVWLRSLNDWDWASESFRPHRLIDIAHVFLRHTDHRATLILEKAVFDLTKIRRHQLNIDGSPSFSSR